MKGGIIQMMLFILILRWFVAVSIFFQFDQIVFPVVIGVAGVTLVPIVERIPDVSQSLIIT